MGKISEIFNFENIGGKIKNLAKWSCWITILLTWVGATICFFILLFTKGTFFVAFLVPIAAILYSLLIWVGSWATYAFGEYVENIQAIRSQTSKIYNIDKNLQMIAQPMIDEANEKAKHQAEEIAKRETEKKAKRQADEIAKREAEEKAKRQAEEIAKREAEKKAEQVAQKKEQTLSEKLEYALMFQSDDGMVRYLKDIQNETVQNILKSPTHLIREQIKNLLTHM